MVQTEAALRFWTQRRMKIEQVEQTNQRNKGGRTGTLQAQKIRYELLRISAEASIAEIKSGIPER